MTVTNVHRDPERLTMTVTAEFDAPVDRVWQLWADPRLLEVDDCFADGDGNPLPDMPVTTMRVTLDERADGGTKVEIRATFPSLEHMQQLIDMGMEEGLQQAMGQMDALVAA